MTRTLAISDTGLRLIKAFEGFRPDDRTLVTGTRVVGYGHRLDIGDESVHMSRAEAEEQLLEDLEPIEEIVNDEVHAPLSQGQFDALCSLAFNIGPKAFRASDIVRAMNNGRVLDAANGFDVWRKASVNGKTYVIDALMRRRTAEKSLFLRNEPAVPAPSAMLQPEPDGLAPFGPTEDGLPKVTVGEATGVIDGANIINADRVDPVAVPTGSLSLSDLAARAEDDDAGLYSADLIDEDESDDLEDEDLEDEDFEDEDFEDDDLADEDVYDDDDEDEDLTIDDASDDDLDDDLGDDLDDDLDNDDPDDMSDDEVAGYDDLLDDEWLEAEAPEDDKDDAPDTLRADVLSLSLTDEIDDGLHDGDDALHDAQDAVEDDTHPSAISSAATSLGDRLSALLDADETETKEDRLEALPESLLHPVQTHDDDADGTLVLNETEDRSRSNLVSFPKRELILEDAEETDPVTIEGTQINIVSDAVSETKGMLVIDDLAADDVIRASRDPENPVFDPEGDPVENAMRYLERQASEKQAKESNGGMWIPIALGALLFGASAVLIGRGATQLLSTWGPTAVTAAAITGGLTLLFALYAFARGRSA